LPPLIAREHAAEPIVDVHRDAVGFDDRAKVGRTAGSEFDSISLAVF
jgi:hypothetical protein